MRPAPDSFWCLESVFLPLAVQCLRVISWVFLFRLVWTWVNSLPWNLYLWEVLLNVGIMYFHQNLCTNSIWIEMMKIYRSNDVWNENSKFERRREINLVDFEWSLWLLWFCRCKHNYLEWFEFWIVQHLKSSFYFFLDLFLPFLHLVQSLLTVLWQLLEFKLIPFGRLINIHLHSIHIIKMK